MENRPMKSGTVSLDGGSATLATVCFAKYHITIITPDGKQSRLSKRHSELLRQKYGPKPVRIAKALKASLMRHIQALAA